ncbi:MAG: hypothetical protein KatS3mg110_0647 [Pirellulaceae bacterium]|nr:MAG: hypothetical protein KatS3mg110_0647 [Pirellulaceae bacterium]
MKRLSVPDGKLWSVRTMSNEGYACWFAGVSVPGIEPVVPLLSKLGIGWRYFVEGTVPPRRLTSFLKGQSLCVSGLVLLRLFEFRPPR